MEEDVQEFLEHFGIKGMQWGVRKDESTGVSRATSKNARKDAEEFARAQMYYGKGAGTRRKLIKATVDAKKAKDPNYAKAFDQHLAKQDMSSHAEKARSERHATDRKTKAKQSAGFLARHFTGQMGTTAAFTAAALAGGLYLRSDKGQAMMRNYVNKVADRRESRAGVNYLRDYFQRNG